MSEGKELKVKSFNKKRRIIFIISAIAMLACGIMFLVVYLNTFTTILLIFTVFSFVVGVTLILLDILAQLDLYYVFTPEYCMQIKRGKEGEKVYWDTVYYSDFSKLQKIKMSSPLYWGANFQVSYKKLDKDGNYSLRCLQAFIPVNEMPDVQDIIPIIIDDGKYLTELRKRQLFYKNENVEIDKQPDKEQTAEKTNGATPSAVNKSNKRPYIKLGGGNVFLLIAGAILTVGAAVTYLLYNFVEADALLICEVIFGYGAILFIEVALLSCFFVYRYNFNPYKRKLVILCAVLFCIYLGMTIFAFIFYDIYSSEVDEEMLNFCVSAFIFGTVICLVNAIYYYFKRQVSRD